MKTKFISTKSKLTAMLSLSLALFQGRTDAATHVWTGAGINANWNNGNNWAGGATPTASELAPVIIEFPANINGSVTNNVPGMKVDSLRLLGSGLTINGANDVSLTLRGGNVSTNLFSAGVNYLGSSLPLVLEGVARVESPVLLAIYSPISGSGGLSIAGGVRFDGVLPNNYSGETTIRSGVLTLSRQILILNSGTFGVVSVPSALVVEAGTVIHDADGGIADDATVTIGASGSLNLNGHDDAIGGLILAGGDVQTVGGTLTLNGDVAVTENGSALSGRLSLGGSTRTINVGLNRIATISAVISGGGGVGQPGLTKAGAGELVLTGDNTFSGSTAVNDGTLEIQSASALGSGLFGGVNVAAPATLSLVEGVIVSPRPLVLNGGKLRATGNASWTGAITLNGDCTAQCSFTGTALSLSGVIGGNGNLTHIGNGKLALLGTNANAFTGTVALTDGILELGKSSGQAAISGSLVIGGFFHTNNADLAFLTAPNQIAPNATVTILGSGLLHLNGQNETLEALVFQGGEIQTGNGTLTLAGPLTVNASSQYARIAGKLALSAGTNSLNVAAGGDGLEISAIISGANTAALRKDGDGELYLLSDNAYFGPTVVGMGWLVLRHPHGLGDSNPFNSLNGTFVSDGATLALDSVSDVPEKLTLNGSGSSNIGALFNQVGNNSWAGPIFLNTDTTVSTSFNAPLELKGVISGNGDLIKLGLANVTIGGTEPNVFTGRTYVREGRVVLAKPAGVVAIPYDLTIGDHLVEATVEDVLVLNDGQISTNALVNFLAPARLDLNNHEESIRALAGDGDVVLGSGKLRVGGGIFTGTISGLQGRVEIVSSSYLMLMGTNTYTGDTLIRQGLLRVCGSLTTSQIYVTNNGTLGGNGLVGTVHLTGGKLAPDTAFNNCLGKLNGGAVYLNAQSTFAVDLAGELPGTQHDQLVANNIVQLQGKLVVTLTGSTVSGDVFTIIRKDSAGTVSGTFSSLPEGQTLHVNSRPFQITYHGGDGNDVVLTQTGQVVVPHIDSIVKLPNGHAQLNGSGIPFHLYTIERSEDLAAWTPIETVAANDAGTIQYADAEAPTLPKAFYRLLAVEDNGQF